MQAVLLVALALFSACEPFTADPNGSTELELSEDLSTAQAVAVHNAVLEINAAVGREVFHVRGEHAGIFGHVTINAKAPPKGYRAYTHLYAHRAEINLGKATATNFVVHELIHVVLGDDDHHSEDPADVFNAHVNQAQVITQPTLDRITDAMGGEP